MKFWDFETKNTIRDSEENYFAIMGRLFITCSLKLIDFLANNRGEGRK